MLDYVFVCLTLCLCSWQRVCIFNYVSVYLTLCLCSWLYVCMLDYVCFTSWLRFRQWVCVFKFVSLSVWHHISACFTLRGWVLNCMFDCMSDCWLDQVLWVFHFLHTTCNIFIKQNVFHGDKDIWIGATAVKTKMTMGGSAAIKLCLLSCMHHRNTSSTLINLRVKHAMSLSHSWNTAVLTQTRCETFSFHVRGYTWPFFFLTWGTSTGQLERLKFCLPTQIFGIYAPEELIKVADTFITVPYGRETFNQFTRLRSSRLERLLL